MAAVNTQEPQRERWRTVSCASAEAHMVCVSLYLEKLLYIVSRCQDRMPSLQMLPDRCIRQDDIKSCREIEATRDYDCDAYASDRNAGAVAVLGPLGKTILGPIHPPPSPPLYRSLRKFAKQIAANLGEVLVSMDSKVQRLLKT